MPMNLKNADAWLFSFQLFPKIQMIQGNINPPKSVTSLATHKWQQVLIHVQEPKKNKVNEDFQISY